MIGKYTVPYALSGATALVVACLGISKLHAAEHEAPAVLNFATSYLQQQPQPPRLPEPPSASREPGKTIKPKKNHTSVESGQLTALRRDLKEKTRKIAQKNGAINALEQQIIALKKSASTPVAVNKAPHLVPADKEAMLDLVKNLRQVSSLHPTHNSLVTKLAQAEEQLKEVQRAEATLRSQLKTLNDGKDRLVSAHEGALKQQIEQHNAKITELEAHLSSSRQSIEKITAERDDIKAKEQKLAAEKQVFDKEKQQLLGQIAHGSTAEGQLTASVKQQQVLQQQIEQHNAKITELEAHLSSSRQDIEKMTAERDNILAKEQKLAAENTAEKQAFDKEKQQLLQQIAQKSSTEGQLDARQALEQQLAEAKQLKTALQGDKDRLQAQLAESQLLAKSLQTKMDLVQLQQPAVAVVTAGAVPTGTSPKGDNQDSDKKLPELQAKLDAALAELATVKKQKSDVKSASSLLGITPEQLNKKSAREGYAIGMSLGDEILQMQADNNNWGTATEKNLVLAGIVDAFQGQTKLSTDVLRNTLSEVTNREREDQEKRGIHLDETTKKYLNNFTKNKKTKKSPSGFWYNINYEGDDAIPKNATLDIVVRESLTNGNVVTDMDASGTMLSQPLSEFPPVFREALEKLRNHGSITIVVPPELAYKDKGFPPKIPPNATMIYDLRIAGIH
ncbi:FKBP-type peptidyl-prolyl cis-trans isomerase N-terminal domain-containing protein [Erwinia sp. AnSW2-5]|uniref:FKBP-type peptidyl-prolyl cis-trans isomerase N-terminal domain-containing protein n=1 Tax=Erwinia sp. AnSW2-5 TaxID=3367692 RepID=UPI00385A9507